DNFSRKVASWDRAYLEYAPPQLKWMQFTAGKFPVNWLKSPMTFDVDLFPEGLSERFSFDSDKTGGLKNISLQGMQLVANEQAAGPDAMIVGGQISSRFSFNKRFSTTAAFTGMTFRHPEYVLRGQLSHSNFGTLNTNAVLSRGGEVLYAS